MLHRSNSRRQFFALAAKSLEQFLPGAAFISRK
jgi:hypothetical protein